MDSKLIVIAIGGNSLIEDAGNVSVKSQYDAAAKTASHIARLVGEGHRIVIVHGNGPQVGYILRRAEIASTELHTVPLDSCVADTQGAIGYQLQMALSNKMEKKGIRRSIVTVVTQVEVDPSDPSFSNPTKPIGSFMSESVAMEHRDRDGWNVVEDAGRGWRRVVPSPRPLSIIELDTIRTLLDAGIIVIAAGGGGIPVARECDGTLSGREAVIDKDLAAAMLAKDIGADMFVISTAVEKVCLDYGKPGERALDTMDVREAEEYIRQGQFPAGSMLPKILALRDFVESTGRTGIVTDPLHLFDAVHGEGGTVMHP